MLQLVSCFIMVFIVKLLTTMICLLYDHFCDDFHFICMIIIYAMILQKKGDNVDDPIGVGDFLLHACSVMLFKKKVTRGETTMLTSLSAQNSPKPQGLFCVYVENIAYYA